MKKNSKFQIKYFLSNCLPFTLIFFFCCCSSTSFRIETVSYSDSLSLNANFIIPPDTDFPNDDIYYDVEDENMVPLYIFDKNSEYRYHFLKIRELNNDYYECLDKIEYSSYWWDKDPEIKTKDSSSFWCLKYFTNNSLLIQLDYNKLFSSFGKSRESLVLAFSELTKNMLIELDSSRNKDWAETICQNIVNKLFEVIPLPEGAELLRFGYICEPGYSTLILNPSISILHDTISKTDTPPYFMFEYKGKILITYRNYDKMSNSVFIKQSPFLQFDKRSMRKNVLEDNDSSVINLSSSSDIEMSKEINSFRYIGINTIIPKPNNNYTSEWNESFDADSNNRNSYLVFSNSISPFYNKTGNHRPLKPLRFAIFGPRNLITPVIPIQLNNKIAYIPFNCDVNYLLNILGIEIEKIERKYYNEYYDFMKFNRVSKIMPGDKIFTK